MPGTMWVGLGYFLFNLVNTLMLTLCFFQILSELILINRFVSNLMSNERCNCYGHYFIKNLLLE